MQLEGEVYLAVVGVLDLGAQSSVVRQGVDVRKAGQDVDAGLLEEDVEYPNCLEAPAVFPDLVLGGICRMAGGREDAQRECPPMAVTARS